MININKIYLFLFYFLLTIKVNKYLIHFKQISINQLLESKISITYNNLFIIYSICIFLTIIPIIFFYIWLIIIIIKYILYFKKIFIDKILKYMSLGIYNNLYITLCYNVIIYYESEQIIFY